MSILSVSEAEFGFEVPVVIIGAGGCGLSAALAAAQCGVETLVLERDPTPLGTTAMSTGLIPAAGSALQQAAGISDSPELFTDDVMKKTRGETDEGVVRALAEASARTVDWLHESGVPLSLVDSFLYPGHSVKRMHGTPNRTGAELMGALQQAAEDAGAGILTQAQVTHVFADDTKTVRGVRCQRPDGSTEDVGCESLILACCGFAGDPEKVAQYMPEIAEGVFFGHPGNKGDAIDWGQQLGAAVADMSAYQGHGGLADGHAIPILWPVIMEGGFQVNREGRRFSNESRGYSEQAVDVLRQPGHVAYTIFDHRLHELMEEFDDYRDALKAKAVRTAPTLAALAELIGIDAVGLVETAASVAQLTEAGEPDEFGRVFASRPALTGPFYAVRVTGALFHTQGGLVVDENARVLDEAGTPLPNLFAGGGAARGISGPSCWGYMAGNGLLTATTLGRLAGETAAAQASVEAA
ncbi:MAG: FAD-dependent oxidoreductase [Pseudomonadota bacterium]